MKINIGLTDNTGNPVPLHSAFQQAAKLGRITASRIVAGEDEDCLALEITGDANPIQIHSACNALAQDCIAVVWQSGEGELVGPNAVAWGAFNPDFFIQPN